MVALKTIIVTAVAGLIISNSAGAVAATSVELIDNSNEYDKKEVIYSGEVIGDVMKRGGNAWINVSDGTNAIGIWIPAESAEEIRFTGRYGYVGDTVEVTGIFNRACAEHGGDLDIHSTEIRVVKEGHKVAGKINLVYAAAALLLLAAAAVLNIIILKKRL